MSQEQPPDQARDLANLRLEVHALATKINAESLPDHLRGLRRTISWSAVVIAFALLMSGVMHMCGTSKIDKLEKRVEQLEKTR